ncbi:MULTISPECIES: ABC transporter substrate-binding protein [unclassified Halomonas]|uniref:ABC transporter substrate-binding protein n=1 Tax=unclassified Halomonas TaxID=2609666 RepID=UPI000E891607|nr:ABC transporter substrate-binding protein [Halomonas sp. 3D7M]HBS82781.1 hypothetical protein [Halomonas campaniensis]
MTRLYTQNTDIVVKYQNGAFRCPTRYKRITSSIILLIGLLIIRNVSMASDDSSTVPLATFDFTIAETLNAIGHPPRFLAGLEIYEKYDGIIPRATNLGYLHLPNLELLASLPARRILISPPAHVSLIPRLREIADVEEYPFYKFSNTNNEQDHWNVIEDVTRMLGDLVSAPAASEQYIEQTNHRFDDLKKQINSIDTPLLIIRLMDERHARVHGNGSIEGMVLNRLGLRNAWQEKTGQWGFTTTSVGPLFNTNAKMIFLNSPYDPPGRQRQLLTDGQWRHLPSVRQGNYIIIPINYWLWGGFPSALRFAESLVEALEEPTTP